MTTTSADVPTIDLSVGGMTCAGCAAGIQRGLAVLPGVATADVNIATRRARVLPDGTLDREDLETAMRAAIVGLGYQVLSPERGQDGRADDARVQDGGTLPTEPSGDPLDALAIEHAGHRAADAARVADLRRRFTVAAVLTLPVALVSMVPALQFAGWEWVVAALSTVVIWWAGWPFHRATVAATRHRTTTMDTLVTVGTSAAWAWSTVVLVGHALGALPHAHLYYETGAVIVTLILVGKWLEVRSTARAGDAIRALSSRQSATAMLEDGTEIPRTSLTVGMRFVTRPGEVVATDGVVVDGTAAIDAALVTGESAPVRVGPGSEVVGGTIATDGALTVEATRVGAQTMLAQIARMVDEAQAGKARVQRLVDRIASIFVPVVLALAAVTLVGWLVAGGGANAALSAAVAVLIISCPCALGLATPLAMMVGTGRGAQLGILVRGPQVLEDARAVEVVVVDKTGTLTQGKPALADTYGPGLTANELDNLLIAAATIEAKSEHPVGHAIAQAVSGRALSKGFRPIPGQGVTATVKGAGIDGADAQITVGSWRLFDRVEPALVEWAGAREQAGETVVYVGRTRPLGSGLLEGGGVPEGSGGGMAITREPLHAVLAIAVRDEIKPSAAPALDDLRRLGLSVVLLTGDNDRTARSVAAELGIDTVVSQVLPGDKAATVKDLQATGKRVAMVGDGVNDAPALAQADLGIAIGTGADVAREASDLTLVTGDLRGTAQAIALARRTLGTIRGNLFWAFAYNVAAIPLAALGVLDPMIAAAAMGASSLFVVGNSLRLRRFGQ